MAPTGRVEGLVVDLELIRALAAGRIGEAAARRAPKTDHAPLVEALVDAELATRRGKGTVAALVELAGRVGAEASDVPALRWWAGALLAERCGLDLDVVGARRAAAVLADVPDDPLVPAAVLWIRGRLRRVAALVTLFGPQPDRAAFRRLRSHAIADFTRGGFHEEVAVTRVLAATVQSVWLLEDVEQNVAAAVDARAMVDQGSVWSALLDPVLAVLAVAADDRVLADRCLAAQDGPRPPFMWGGVAPILRAFREVQDGDGSPAATEALVEAAVHLRGTDPVGGHRLRLVAASALVDLGQSEIARGLALPVLDMPPVDQVDELERDVLVLRLRLHAGEDVPLAAMSAALDRLAALGHPARIAMAARNLAEDLITVGRPGDASALRGHRPASLDPPSRERPAHRSAAVRVRVMAPVVTVEVSGERRDLRTMAVRLLLALILAHPDPLAAETAADALWPAAPWNSDRRRRLNAVVHRLRQGLGDAGGAVRRVGDLLTLTTDGWDVDLFRLRHALRRAAAGDGDRALAEALAGVSGNLAHIQFPYDDQLVDERQVLLAAVSRRLGTDAAGPAPVHLAHPEHAAILQALGAPPPLTTM